jgi:hypothetical protein
VVQRLLSGCGGVAVVNKANGVGGVGGVSVIGDAVGMGAGDTSSVAVGAGTASFVPKTNSSIALPSGLRFLVPALSGVNAELGLEALL